MAKELNLKVAEAIQDDVNKGIVRIDNSLMAQVGVREGDLVEIEGGRVSAAIVARAYPGDIGFSHIRMDGIIRRNAKTGIGELVKVRKAMAKPAKRVVIAPASKGVHIKASPEIFRRGLLGKGITKGDIVSLGGRTRRPMQSPFFDNTGAPQNRYLDDIFSILDESSGFGLGYPDIKFLIVDTFPKGIVVVTDQTKIEFNPEAVEIKDDKVLEVTYEDIGGLEQEITKIREMVELPIKHPELFERLGIDPPKGVLLHGPPGTGKTLLAKAVATETNANFILINGPEIMSKYYGQSEENLRKKFEEAEQNAPSIIFIDEIDAIASKREESRGEVERRVVAQLLAIMDGLKARGKVVVIAATNIPNLLDPALRRPGRFDRELEISVPNKEGRLRILKIHTRNMPLAPQNISTDVIANILRRNVQEAITKLQDDQKTNGESHETELTVLRNLEKDIKDNKGTLTKVARQVKKVAEKSILEEDDLSKIIMESLEGNEKEMAKAMLDAELITLRTIEQTRYESSARELEAMAAITHGFVGADLAALAKESAMIVLRRLLPEIRLDDEERIPRELLEKLRITQKDFQEALKVVRPSALREVLVENPNVAWEDIGGLEEVKQELKEAVEWPLQHPDAFKRLGVRPPKGILLYGAPGSGKTMLAKAVATEAESNFIVVKGPELLSKWVGESEKAVREIFKKARTVSPSIIFFDEIDSIAPRRGASSDSHVTERVVNQLLTEMDGLVGLHDIVIIGATNRPDMLDTALLRPGRFDRIILTPAPDKGSRLEIFKVHTKSMPLASDVKLETLAKDTEGYVGADIESVCREAAMLALRENMKAKEIKKKHFTEALKRVRPSVSKEVEETYAQLKEHFSSAQAEEMKVERPSYMG